MKAHSANYLRSILLLLTLFATLSLAQEVSEFNPVKNSNGSDGFLNSIMNPERYTLNHSISFMTTSGGGQSGSVGVFSNYLNYRINEKLYFKAGLHLIKPSYSQYGGELQKADFNYDFQLNYDYSDNVKFQFNLVKINSDLYRPMYSRVGMYPF